MAKTGPLFDPSDDLIAGFGLLDCGSPAIVLKRLSICERINGKAAGEEANQADSLATPNDAALLA
jgi:hypothetical protein